MNKRGQDAAGVGTFLFIFTALVLLYVLLLPEVDRQELLGTDGSSGGSGVDSRIIDILKESPGTLTPEGRDVYDYNIPSVVLSKRTNARVLVEEGFAKVKNGWFVKRPLTMKFSLDDLDNTEQLLLSFNVQSAKGELRVVLNNEVVFNGAVQQASPQPIPLPQEALKEGTNELIVSTSSVGMRFWRQHTYVLTSVQVIADITDVSQQRSRNLFYIPESRRNVEIASLKYVPECDERYVGVLDVSVNDQLLFSGVPNCAVLNILTIPPEFLLPNMNYVTFSAGDGTYLIDRIKVSTLLKERFFPTYYFFLDEDQFRDIRSPRRGALLDLTFLDPEEGFNEIVVIVNGREHGVRTRNQDFTLLLDPELREGNNVIKIIPLRTVDLLEVELTIERL